MTDPASSAQTPLSSVWTRRAMAFLLAGLLVAGVLVGGRTRPSTRLAPGEEARVVESVCDAADAASRGNTEAAVGTFLDRSHEGLHAMARSRATGAAPMLEADRAVEGLLYRDDPGELEAALLRLHAAAAPLAGASTPCQ